MCCTHSNGELVVRKSVSGESGTHTTTTIGTRSRGDVLGEIAFLLEATPLASVAVAEDYPRDVTIVEVEYARAVALLQSDPKFACKVFQMLASVLAQRLAQLSDSKTAVALHVSSTHAQQQEQVKGGGKFHIDESHPDPEDFELDPDAEFLAQAPCTVTVEDKRERRNMRQSTCVPPPTKSTSRQHPTQCHEQSLTCNTLLPGSRRPRRRTTRSCTSSLPRCVSSFPP